MCSQPLTRLFSAVDGVEKAYLFGLLWEHWEWNTNERSNKLIEVESFSARGKRTRVLENFTQLHEMSTAISVKTGSNHGTWEISTISDNWQWCQCIAVAVTTRHFNHCHHCSTFSPRPPLPPCHHLTTVPPHCAHPLAQCIATLFALLLPVLPLLTTVTESHRFACVYLN